MSVRRRLALLVLGTLTSVATVFAVSTPAYAWNVDRPKITNDMIDFGGSVWSGSGPVGAGHLYWNVGPPDYDIVTPELDGTLHLKNAEFHCGRMHISYWDASGDLLYTDHGGGVCTDDDDHHSWHVNRAEFSSEDITEVHICTELRIDAPGTAWQIIGCDTMIKDLRTQ